MNDREYKEKKRELLESYISISVTKGKLLNSREINDSNNLSSCTVYWRYFEGIEDLKRKTGMKDDTEIKEKICRDCVNNPKKCTKNRQTCYEECDEFYLEVLRGNKKIKSIKHGS